MSMSSSAVRRKIEPAAYPYQEVSASGGANPAEQNPEQEQQARENAAHAAGLREGEARARAGFEAQIQETRREMTSALDQFTHERREYFLAVEREVVQLALGITRKILHREAQVDPLLLAGMVRVALDRINEAGKVTLRVHPSQVSDFRIFFAHHAPETQPEVVEDSTLGPQCCVLETSLGKTEIGPEIQLKEIEQGLLDLQSARPK